MKMNRTFAVLAVSLSLGAIAAQADQLYVLHFEDEAGKKSLVNTGTVKGSADEVPGNNAAIEYSRKTNSGSGFALKFPMDTGGQSGPAISLPDSAGKLALADMNDEMTIALWVKWSGKNGVDQNDFQILVSKMSDSQDDGWAFGVTQTGNLRFLVGGFGSRVSKDAITADKWTHIAVTFRPRTGLHFFIDGKETPADQDFTAVTVKATKQPILIGAAAGKFLPSNATVDDVLLLDEVTSTDDIELLMTPKPAAGSATTKP